MGTAPPPRSTNVPSAPSLVGREHELAAVEDLLSGDEPATGAALVLEGAPGVGKTSIWEHALSLARARGRRVLSARASGALADSPYAAVIDLLDGILVEELGTLPAPQLHALNVALYREEPNGRATGPQAASLGLLSALRALSTEQPLLVAIDDVQWLDRASDEALAYVVRRLGAEGVRFLLARRPGRPSELEAALPGELVRKVAVEPMSLGATRQLLASRLGLRLPHHLLRRVYETTLGNPLFALEVGRVLAGRDLGALGEDVPVPHHVEDLLGLRIADLDGAARELLVALALDAELGETQLQALAGRRAVERAVEDGLLTVTGQRARPSHPLLAATAKGQATREELRSLHRRLADVVTHEPSRALHLAFATPGEDEVLAEQVAEAAALAAARAAPRLAVQLSTHALRLTPATSPRHATRMLELGRHLMVAGEKQRLVDLLGDRVGSLPDPESRVTACLLLTQGIVRDNGDIRRLLERALLEADGDSRLRGPVLADLAENEAVITVSQVARAERRAEEAVAAPTGRPDDRRRALSALAWTRALRGRPVDDLFETYSSLADYRLMASRRPERVAGQRAVWRGEVSAARELLTMVKTLAEERGEPSTYALARLHLCELALRVGGWTEAQGLLDDWAASTDDVLLHWPMYERCRALLAVGRGDPAEARRWADLALEHVASTGVRWDWLEVQRALGVAALLDKRAAAAVEHLAAVWQHTETEGVEDPGAFPVAPDLVEALVESGDVAAASEVTRRLAELAGSQAHPWGLAGARRSEALVTLGGGAYDQSAADALAAAAAAYDGMGLAFDAARTWLALGRWQRRARKWGAARDALERAAGAFDRMGSAGWAEEARRDLDRVGARRPSPRGGLTATEERVAGLAVDGLSNKEIARTLVVTVNTVEFHLRNAYAKLGIRSRGQLAASLREEEHDPRT